jgi:hypothetical protein
MGVRTSASRWRPGFQVLLITTLVGLISRFAFESYHTTPNHRLRDFKEGADIPDHRKKLTPKTERFFNSLSFVRTDLSISRFVTGINKF